MSLSNILTLPDLLTLTATRYPNKNALIFEDRKFTYRELAQRVQDFAKYLYTSNKKGSVIAVLLPNSPELVISYFGILRAGCTVLLIPHNTADHNLLFQINKTRCKTIICNEVLRPKLKRAGVLKQVNFIDIEKPIPSIETNQLPRINPSDYSTILFTSGTTSEPKGVLLKHSNVIAATKNIIEYVKFRNSDIDLNISSLAHSFGLGHLHCIFAVGGTTILFRDAINLKKILATIKEHKVTTFAAVPTILQLLLTHYRAGLRSASKTLRFIQTNTSKLEPSFIKSLLRSTPKTMFHYYYGLSEASRSTFITFNKHPQKIESVGRPSPNVHIKIVDAHNKSVPTGSLGEICIKGSHVIESYWKNTKESKRIINKWLHTKDAGYLDKQNFLFVVGRMDDVINVAGEKVSPDEIENALKKISGVTDAGVIGIPDVLLGQAVKAYITVDSKKITTEKILVLLRKNLENYKIPKVISIIDSIPRTENGKLQRALLRGYS